MQRCDDAGIFTKLSGIKTKAWGFGSGGNMMFSGSVVCIYDGFGKPTISKITYEKKGEAEIYVQTNNSITNQNQVEVIIPKVFTIHVFDLETKSSFEIYQP
ncbi:hypothetical protein [Paenibacillus sp. MMO-58]|uniref:hypothetical protein n=1 Tax=Paenibacillus sp. MMO-58 TaxID=3081290 RepID=UPI003016A563